MESNASLLIQDSIWVSDKLSVRIPTVGEVLEDERQYYNTVNLIIASPYSMMVQLADMGIDFEEISDYELFLMYAPITFSKDLTVIFGDAFERLREILSNPDISQALKDEALCLVKKQDSEGTCVYDRVDDILIDEYIYYKIAEALRKINNIEPDKRKPGNEEAKRYLIKKNRKYQRRHKSDEYKPVLERLVVAFVNKQEFKYNYEETMDLSIYKFNRSAKQIKHTVNFDKTMIGVYAGTVDTSKMTDKSVLSFIET